MAKYKLKICTFDNEPLMKAQAERIEEFEPMVKGLKDKINGRKH